VLEAAPVVEPPVQEANPKIATKPVKRIVFFIFF
jgi:hypothetical protein